MPPTSSIAFSVTVGLDKHVVIWVLRGHPVIFTAAVAGGAAATIAKRNRFTVTHALPGEDHLTEEVASCRRGDTAACESEARQQPRQNFNVHGCWLPAARGCWLLAPHCWLLLPAACCLLCLLLLLYAFLGTCQSCRLVRPPGGARSVEDDLLRNVRQRTGDEPTEAEPSDQDDPLAVFDHIPARWDMYL